MAERGGDKSRTPKETKEKEKQEKNKGREAKAKKNKLKKALAFSPETPPTQLKKTKFQDDTETPKEHQSSCEKGEG